MLPYTRAVERSSQCLSLLSRISSYFGRKSIQQSSFVVSNACWQASQPSRSTSISANRSWIRRTESLRRFATHARAAKKSVSSVQSGEGSDKDKKSALEDAMLALNAQFGVGTVARLGSTGGAVVETFSSGNLALDVALGGGIPKGRIVEIYGPESSGKTTLALHAIAEVQRAGGNAMLIDAEHALDVAYAKALGVDVDQLILMQPDSGEMALEAADVIIRSKGVQLICVDSVSALTPRAELEGEIGQNQIGLQARLMSSSLRKLAANASKAGCTLIFLNQIRYKIGVLFGNPETTSGGNALKFFASVRMEVRMTGKIKAAKTGEDDVGIRCRVKVVKSKVSRPFRQAEFDVMFGAGVSRLGCIVDCAIAMGLVSKKGKWYSFGDVNFGGRENVMQYLIENPEKCNELEKSVRSRIDEDRRRLRDPEAFNSTVPDDLATVGVLDSSEDNSDSEELEGAV